MSSSTRMSRDQLIQRISEVALLRGDFTLRSGRKSSYYLDKYRFETQPDVLVELGHLFAEKAKAAKVDRIAGPELGAVALAAAASMFSGLPFVLVRNQKKGYGGDKLIEGVLKEGESVLIVEDILTTGGQVLEAAQSLKDSGAIVTKIVATIDRLEGARENIEKAGYTLETLFTVKELM